MLARMRVSLAEISIKSEEEHIRPSQRKSQDQDEAQLQCSADEKQKRQGSVSTALLEITERVGHLINPQLFNSNKEG